MRNTKIGKLLLTMSLPAILSMLVQALYNIVDSLFLTGIDYNVAGYIGEDVGADSFLAVSIAMPMTMLVVALGIGIGVGANAYVARKLGEGNRQNADKCAKTALIMALCAWAVMIVLAFTVSKPFITAFVEQDEERFVDVNYVIEQGSLYLTMYMALSGGVILDITLARILQATGNMKIPMITQLVGALTNIGLDALFIMAFKWGVLGAIVATVIGQWTACAIDLIVFFTKKQDVSINLKGFKPSKHYFLRIARIGAPALIMNAMGSVITIIMNVMLKSHGMLYVNVLSAYFKVQSFVFMPVFGLMQGAMPILSYNYGANEKKRFNSAFRLALYICLGVMVAGTLLFQLCPEFLMSIFKSKPSPNADVEEIEKIALKNAEFVKEGAYAFRCISIAFIPAAFSVLLINMLQSINRPVSSLLMSLSRQLLFLIPSAILFNYLWQTKGIWFCYPFAEILAVLVYSPFAIRDYKRQFKYKAEQYASHQLGDVTSAPAETTE